MTFQSGIQALLSLTGPSMDPQTQRQAIVDRLTGQPLHKLPAASRLDEPWRTILRRVNRAVDRADAETLIWRATEGLEWRTTEGLEDRR